MRSSTGVHWQSLHSRNVALRRRVRAPSRVASDAGTNPRRKRTTSASRKSRNASVASCPCESCCRRSMVPEGRSRLWCFAKSQTRPRYLARLTVDGMRRKAAVPSWYLRSLKQHKQLESIEAAPKFHNVAVKSMVAHRQRAACPQTRRGGATWGDACLSAH